MPTYDYICETCGHSGRGWRTEEQGPPLFCSRDCQKRSKNPRRRRSPNKWVITPDMHNTIRAAYQGDTGNGQIRDLAILLGLPRMKKTNTISLRAKRENRREKRAFAALHCVHYQECLDRVSKKNKQMECHKCDRLKFETDTYRKEVGVHTINNYDSGEHAIRVDYNERH